MLSLSDERIADPSARLLYHAARMLPHGPVTVAGSEAIHADLSRLEVDHITLLVDRAFDGVSSRPALIAQAERCDHRVLELLLPALLSPRESAPRAHRGFVKLLGRTVQHALRTGDRLALAKLYRALFALEMPISARLARTFRLVDSLGVPAAARPAGRPWLRVPHWRSLYPPDGDVTREVLTRHLLAVGDTGCCFARNFVTDFSDCSWSAETRFSTLPRPRRRAGRGRAPALQCSR